MLGVQPIVGRNFRPDEDRPDAEPVALISQSLWKGRLGGDPNITERRIRLDGVRRRIVRVMPAGFNFPQSSQVWAPLALSPADLEDRGSHYLSVYGLLRPGMPLEQAQADVVQIAH